MCGSCILTAAIETDKTLARELTDEDKAGLANALDVLTLEEVSLAIAYFDEAGEDVPSPLETTSLEEYEVFARKTLLELAEKYPNAFAVAGAAAIMEAPFYAEPSLEDIAREIGRLLSEAFDEYADVQVNVF